MVEVPLTQNKVALVSKKDYEKVMKFKWCASNESCGRKWYAIRRKTINGKRVKIRMHRFLMGLGTGFEDDRVVHHKNDDGLDNRQENLQIVKDNKENMYFSKGWKRPIEQPFL